MLKKHSLNKQFSYTFVLIILCTLLTIVIEVIVFSAYVIKDTKILPANHFEKIVPKIENTISENKGKVVEVSFEKVMNGIAPKDGIKYIVLDNRGEYLYGNTELDSFPHYQTLEKQWITRLNTKEVTNNVVTKYIPIMDDDNNLIGECVLQYKLKVTYKDKVIKDILWGILLSPFIIVVVFTVIFGRRLSKNIKEPLGILTEAADKIKNNNLDFHINYPYKNELGDVINSFENMREELHKTLHKQWKLEEEKNLMISAISHDLRTPLTIIKGHAEMLNDGAYKKEERLLKYLESIENSSDWAVALLNDMNTFIKLENADFKLNKEKVDIYRFIEEKVKEYEPLTQEKNIKIKVEYIVDEDLEKDVQRDVEVEFSKEVRVVSSTRVDKHKGEVEVDNQQDTEVDYQKEARVDKQLIEGKAESDRKIEFSRKVRVDMHEGEMEVDNQLAEREAESDREIGFSRKVRSPRNVRIDKLEDEIRVKNKENTRGDIHKSKREVERQLDTKMDKFNVKRKVMMDELRISQVIDNIITNSIRYSPEDGIINISINLSYDRLKIDIEDSGKGFTNEDLKMATEKFYRGDKSRGSGAGHSGLGLYISRKLVNLHGGKLRIYNNKNGGAGVAFILFGEF